MPETGFSGCLGCRFEFLIRVLLTHKLPGRESLRCDAGCLQPYQATSAAPDAALVAQAVVCLSAVQGAAGILVVAAGRSRRDGTKGRNILLHTDNGPIRCRRHTGDQCGKHRDGAQP